MSKLIFACKARGYSGRALTESKSFGSLLSITNNIGLGKKWIKIKNGKTLVWDLMLANFMFSNQAGDYSGGALKVPNALSCLLGIPKILDSGETNGQEHY